MVTSLLLLAAFLVPQDFPVPKKKAQAKIVAVRPEKTDVKVGETFKVAFDLEITPKWYIYPTTKTTTGKPTTFLMEGAEGAGKVEEPKPKVHPAEDGLEAYEYHDGSVTMTVPLRLKPGAVPGPLEVKGKLAYQICAAVCIDGSTDFSFNVTVVAGVVEAAPVDASGYSEYGFVGLILLGVLGGLVSLVMPCTYPMIPITLTFFVKQAAGSRRHGLVLSTLYSLGIIVTFTGLGFLMSVLLGAGGARTFAADPWVNIAVGALFLWFTGSLFGWYEIQLPFGLGSRLAGGGQRKGSGGAFILGLLFAVVTFTCTIPIAGTILTFAAGQHRLAAFMAMLFYSITMAVPFFLMGVFPGMIKEVPKSGGWMTTVKVSMAFVELALAIFYFGKADQSWEFNVLTRWVVLAAYAGACFVVAVYLLRFFRARPTAGRSAIAAVFLLMGGYMAYGFTGKRLGLMETILLPPPTHGTTLPAGLLEAKRLGKPLFAEFTGIT